ncbi:YrzE family protein [Xanthobacter wiegelii]|uniref:YrzE family protein n=1 Tax=Xanthobacter wiegelii TaxID=3119913 RepID=UPI00372792D3
MVIVLIALVSGLIGGFLASSKGKNVFLWFILCAMFPLVGLIILLFSKNKAAQAALPAGAYDAARWNTLVSYDPELKAAADRLAPYGQSYVDQLARDFLALGDKAYLARIADQIEQAAKNEAAQRRDEVVAHGDFRNVSWTKYGDGTFVAEMPDGHREFRSMDDLRAAVSNRR